MDDRQLYKDTFDQVRSSLVINKEILQMKPKRTNIGRTIAVLAAVVCLLLACGATAVATNLFGLRDLIIAPEAEVGFDGNKETVELISLQGYADSPEAQAAGEWQEFYAAYVPTLNLDNSIFAPGTAYINYSVYDQTMADKLEEIAEKYHLTLYENMADLFDESALNEAMGGPFLSGACTFFWGYCFDDGTLQFRGLPVPPEPERHLLRCRAEHRTRGRLSAVAIRHPKRRDRDAGPGETAVPDLHGPAGVLCVR